MTPFEKWFEENKNSTGEFKLQYIIDTCSNDLKTLFKIGFEKGYEYGKKNNKIIDFIKELPDEAIYAIYKEIISMEEMRDTIINYIMDKYDE